MSRCCVACDRPTRPYGVLAADAPGTIAYASRGLCYTCHRRPAGLDGTPDSYVKWPDIADDYAMLRAEGYPLDVIAARLGMTKAALDKALCRHCGDPRARRPADATGRGRPKKPPPERSNT